MSAGRIPTTANSPLTAKGDLFTYSTGSAKLAVGTNNQVVTADSAEATGLKYTAGSRATLTTTGDIIYASAANTPARLGIGSSAQVLTVSSGIPAWATPSAGSMTLLSTTTLSGASTTISSISGSYKNLYIEVSGFYPDAANSISLRINGLTTGVYRNSTKAAQGSALATSTSGSFCLDVDSVSGTENFGYIYINNYASTTNWKILDIYSLAKNNNGATYVAFYPNYLYVRETNAVSSITLFPVSGNWSAGTVRVYGVN